MNYYDNPAYRVRDPEPPKPAPLLGTLSILNLLIVAAIGVVLMYCSEDWWPGMILTYTPKVPLVIPAGALLFASLFSRRKWVVVNLASLLLVLGPIMGFVAPIEKLSGSAPIAQGDEVHLVSCNIQAFAPDFSTVIAELSNHRPEVVAFQEVRGDEHPLLAKYFDGWNVERREGCWIGSKHPVRFLRELAAPSFERISGLMVEIDLPGGPIRVASVHLMTARKSLGELSFQGLMRGDGPELIIAHQALREQEMMEVRSQIEDYREGKPLIILGDFNTPATSSLFRRWWGDFQSAFDVAGLGWGYTSPCRKDHHYWIPDTPWVRIDHILCTHDWQVSRCEVGRRDGSDHRLIAATLRKSGAQGGGGTGAPEAAELARELENEVPSAKRPVNDRILSPAE